MKDLVKDIRGLIRFGRLAWPSAEVKFSASSVANALVLDAAKVAFR